MADVIELQNEKTELNVTMAHACVNYLAQEAWHCVSRLDHYNWSEAKFACATLLGACHGMSWTDQGDERVIDFWRDVAIEWSLYASNYQYGIDKF